MKIKTAFLLLTLFICATVPVWAQGNEPPIPVTPAEGIYVLDELGWLTNDQESQINGIIERLDVEGVAEIAVVTLNDCGTDKLSFRKSLFNTWGIGHVNDNDGLLILVCWYSGDKTRRSVEQEFGPGLNNFLTGERTDQIMQANFVPAFQQEHPGAGLVAMVRDYEAIFKGNISSQPESSQSNISWDYPLIISVGCGIFVILFLMLFLVLIVFQNRKRDKKGTGKRKANRKKNKGARWWLGGDGGNSGSGGGGGYDGGGGFDGGSSDGGGGSSSNF